MKANNAIDMIALARACGYASYYLEGDVKPPLINRKTARDLEYASSAMAALDAIYWMLSRAAFQGHGYLITDKVLADVQTLISLSDSEWKQYRGQFCLEMIAIPVKDKTVKEKKEADDGN